MCSIVQCVRMITKQNEQNAKTTLERKTIFHSILLFAHFCSTLITVNYENIVTRRSFFDYFDAIRLRTLDIFNVKG